MVLGAETAVRNSGVGLTALCGGVWGPLGRRHSGTEDQRSPTFGSTCPILHHAARCVALVTETRLNVIDG